VSIGQSLGLIALELSGIVVVPPKIPLLKELEIDMTEVGSRGSGFLEEAWASKRRNGSS
jgi:hypothetical protein